MPRGEGYQGTEPLRGAPVGSSSSGSAPRPSPAGSTPRFTDPISGKRYGPRSGTLINPALLRARKGKSLIGSRIDRNLISLIGAFDPLKINS